MADKALHKVCYLILAHHEPRVFHQLIDQVSQENSDVIVHVDRRSDLRAFLRENRGRVHFVRPRQAVHWPGWSITSAILKTLRFALNASDAQYFLFLAGTDFPIRHHNHIFHHLERVYPRNFLNHYPLVPGIWGYGLAARFHLAEYKARIFDARYRAPDKANPLQLALLNALTALQKALNEGYAPREIAHLRLYHGSTRWCLNRETAEFLVDYYYSPESRKLRRFLRLSASSDEIFIQTAILNSPLSAQCVGFDPAESEEIFNGSRSPLPDEKRVYFHYIDWNPERENPAVLDESDFDSLLESDKLFACKFRHPKSAALMEMLHKQILA